MARLPSLKGTDRKSPSVKPSGGVLAFLHRLRPGRATGVNRVANRAPSTSRPSLDAHNAWQAISDTSGSEETKVRSAHTCCCAICRRACDYAKLLKKTAGLVFLLFIATDSRSTVCRQAQDHSVLNVHIYLARLLGGVLTAVLLCRPSWVSKVMWSGSRDMGRSTTGRRKSILISSTGPIPCEYCHAHCL